MSLNNANYGSEDYDANTPIDFNDVQLVNNNNININKNEFAVPRRRDAVVPERPRAIPDSVAPRQTAIPSSQKTIPRSNSPMRSPPKPMPLPITPPQSPKATHVRPRTPPQLPNLNGVAAPTTPPKEAPRATARVISHAPVEEPFRPSLPPKTYQSPSHTTRTLEPLRASAPPKTYQSPTRTNTRSPVGASANSTSRSQSQSPRRSRYDSSPFKSMRSSPMKYGRSPAKSVRGPPRSATSSSRSVYSLPTPPPMPFLRDGMSLASESEYPLEELEEIEAEKSNVRTWYMFLILGVVLLVIIVGTVMGLAIHQANQENKSSTSVVVPVANSPSAPPVEETTLAPIAPPSPLVETAPTPSPQSPSPTPLPTEGDGFNPQYPDVFSRLSTFFTNDKGASIRVEGTPQNRAYVWLEEDMALRKVEPDLNAQMAQRYALAVFYFSTNGDSWTRGENWLSTSDECLWQTDALDGTSCNGKTNLVGISQLVFDKNNIGGTLPAELSILTNLEILSIVNDPVGGTKMTGTMPPELGKLTTIREFVLKNHDMSNSTIPASIFLEWPRATLILMERCKLTGSLPTTIGLLTSATKASFRKNDLTGPIPTEVGEMRKMLQISVDANRLTGTIPTELGLMTDAKGVWLNNNNLVGPIPNEFGNMKLIKAGLRLSDNELTGTIPASLGALTDMKYFELQNNLLTGPVPDFGALSNLVSLNIRDNALTGSMSDASCAAIAAGGTEAYADCPGEVFCACCLNCPQSSQLSSQNTTLRGRMTK